MFYSLFWRQTGAILLMMFVMVTQASATMQTQESQTGLTLQSAIEQALTQSPRLSALQSQLAAMQSAQQQAGLWANPELGFEAENIAGSGSYRGFDSAEITYGITQQLQIGGKLPARRALASHEVELATLAAQSAQLDLVRDVTLAYASAIAAEASMQLAAEQQQLAADILRTVELRVDAAAAPLIQKSRAEVELASARIAHDRALRERDIALRQLAMLMGIERLATPLDSTAFYHLRPPSANPPDANALTTNPDFIQRDIRLARAQSQVTLEQANAIPDPQLNIGVRDLRDMGQQAFVVGVSVPIPVFDANKGHIRQAQHDLLRTEQENRQIELTMGAELAQAYASLHNAHLQATTLRHDILPAAETAFRLAREGYGLGRFPYLEVLDAQRSLFAVRQQEIDAIHAFQLAKARLERLTATHLPHLNGASHDH